MKNKNLCAYPAGPDGAAGLTKLEYFYAATLQGLIAGRANLGRICPDTVTKTALEVAEKALERLEDVNYAE